MRVIVMVQVTLDLSQYDNLGPKMKDVSRRGLQLIALDMQRTVDKLSPIDEGVLHKWFVAEASDSQYTIRSPAKYVGFVNYGTGPHFIRPTHKKALHWTGRMNMSFSGNNISITGSKGGFSKGHMVPGQTGQKFIERAIDQVTPRIDDHFKTAISEVLG